MEQLLIKGNNKKFDITQTQIAKGIACLLLIFHHLFFNSEKYYVLFSSVWKNAGGIPVESILSSAFNVCVPIFVFLSGYGLNASLNKMQLNNKSNTGSTKVYINCTLRHLWTLMMNYWFIFVIFVPWQKLFDHQPYTSFLDGIIDFFGVADIFKTPTMNATWWYMSVVIICYLCTPFLKKVTEKAMIVLILLGASMCFHSEMISWVLIYSAGMIANQYNFFNIFNKLKEKKQYIVFGIVIATLILICAVLKIKTNILVNPFLAVLIIMFSYVFISKIPIINKFLAFLGKHSGNIFLMHTFIFLYDFKSFIYAPKYSILIYILMIAVSVIVSVALEWIKKVIGFNKFVGFVSRKIEKI